MDQNSNYSKKIKKRPLKVSQKAGFIRFTSLGLLNKLFPKATEQGAKTLGEVTSKGLRETFNVGKNVIQGFTNDQIKYLSNQMKKTETHKLLNTCMKDKTTAEHNIQKIAIATGGFLGMFQSVGIGKILGKKEETQYQEKLKKAEKHLQEIEENIKRQVRISKLTKDREDSLLQELDGIKKELKKVQDVNTQLSQDLSSSDELNSLLKQNVTKFQHQIADLTQKIDQKSTERDSYYILYQKSEDIITGLTNQNQNLKDEIIQNEQNKIEDYDRMRKLMSTNVKKLDEKVDNLQIILEREKQKNMLLLSPLIGIPLMIGSLKLYRYLKNRVDKSSPKNSPKKDDLNQSISISQAKKILLQFKNEFYKIYNSKFVDKLFSTINHIIDNNKLYYSLISTLMIIYIYKFSKLKKF